jgi:alkanesulfonate monooxygenase SsuD/methylene tetrahydromethanopterin reductase-like flavin-dependent oxidoreductase (luciferase family)
MKKPKWGLMLTGYNMSLAQIVSYAQRAMEAGAESVWTPELGRDAFMPLAGIAHKTKGLRLGTAVATFARPPLFMANQAMGMVELAEITGNNFVLGLGTAPTQWNRDWHDLDVKKPVARMREYIEAIRLLWEAHPDNPVSYAGDYIRIRDFTPIISAPCSPPPVFLATVGQSMLKLAGECADGIIGNILNTREYFTDVAMPNIRVGQKKGARIDVPFEITTLKPCAVHEDIAISRNCMRPTIAFYSNLPYFDIVLDMAGFKDVKIKIRELIAKGEFQKACKVVPNEMVDTLCFIGSSEQIRECATGFTDVVNTFLISAPNIGVTPEQTIKFHEGIINTFSDW